MPSRARPTTPPAGPSGSGVRRRRGVLLLLTLALALTAVMLAACSNSVVELRDDSGSALSLHLDDVVTITLRSNPSTGYRWDRLPDQAGDEAGVITQRGDVQFTADSDVPGAPGEDRFEFKAEKVGATTLRLAYHRPFETDATALRTFEVQINVE